MSDTILAAAHGPDAADAVALGAALARLQGVTLVVVGVYVVPAGPYARAYEGAARTALQRELDDLAAAVPEDVPHTTLLHASTSAVRGLHELAESDRVRAVVLAASQRGPVGRLVRGDVAAGLLHGAPCAVAVAPRGWAKRGRHPGHPVIGVAWDGGPEARAALDEAAAVAQRTQATLELIAIVEPLPHSAQLDFPDDAAMDRSRRAETTASVEAAAEAVRDRAPVQTVVLDGVPAGRTLVEASAALDALVMGSRSYGPVRRVLFGSVSTHVVREADCPVLVLPRSATPPAAEAGTGSAQDRVPEHAGR